MANYHSVPAEHDLTNAVYYNPYSAAGNSNYLDGNKETREHNEYSRSTSAWGLRLGYFPFSIIILAVWTVVVALVLILLERSASVASTAVDQPWYYQILPGLLLTLFAQAHGPVTAMHLARLAISGLQFSGTAPNTWIELFWLADRSWQGPVGILSTLLAMMRLRTRASLTFFLFATISMVALATPIILSRAYPIKTIDVQQHRNFTPNALTVDRLAGVDAYAQMAAGSGGWATGLSAESMFNSSVFTPPSANGTAALDLFFSGDVEGLDVELPGIRLQGGCQAVSSDAATDDAFAARCTEAYPDHAFLPHSILASSSLSLNASYCTDGGWQAFVGGNDTMSSNISALVRFKNTNDTGMLIGDSLVEGIIRCEAKVSTGRASLVGSSLSFTNFKETLLYNSSAAQAGEPPLQPLFAALYDLIPSSDFEESSSAITILGYTEKNRNGGLLYVQPSLDQLADAMWRGAAHMTAALTLLSRASDTTYPAVSHTPVSGRTRDRVFVQIVVILLGVWALGLIFVTARMFRTTFGDSLNSYAAARLLVDQPELVRGYCCGVPAANPLLLQSFERVGDSEMSGAVGHIASGGGAPLAKDRRYGLVKD